MGLFKLSLNLGLYMLLVINRAFCTNNEISYRLPNNTVPSRYNISLILNLEEGNYSFNGEVSVNIEIRHAPLNNVSLHSKELEVNKTATTLINDKGIVYKPMEHSYNNVTDILTLNFETALSPGFYILKMKFIGIINKNAFARNGFITFSYTNEGKSSMMFATNLETKGARRIFPCWDEPALKAMFNISVTHNQKYRALSNMPIIRQQFFEQNNMTRTHFDTSPIMSTYIVAIVVIPTSEYVNVSNANRTINVWCRSFLTSQFTFMRNIVEKVTPLLTEYTNSSYKVPKMDHVIISNFLVGGMENWGLINYDELSVIYDDSKHPTYKKTEVATVVTHEIVHQWFGNLVTPSWWSYVWLKEGLAVFIQTYIMNKIFENWRTMDFFVIHTLQKCLMTDVGTLSSVTLQPDSTFENFVKLYSVEVYRKAPALMRMLHNIITDEVFRKGLLMYLAKHEYGSTVPDDLWSSMQSALDESNIPHENYRIKEVMDTWMNQNNYPDVNVMRNYETNEVIISQRCTTEGDNKWWIPITFATKSNPDFSNTVPRYWLRPDQNISFVINRNDWIIVNIQQTGYYRVNYNIKNWEEITDYLDSDAYTNIHVLNRAQIIDDLFYFALYGRIKLLAFVNLIRHLYREKDYVAWYPLLFRVIPELKNLLLLPEALYVKITITNLLSGLLRNIGYIENFDDDHITKQTRLSAIKWACTLGDTFCKNTVALKLNQHLADPELYKFAPGQNSMYCTGLMMANRTTWNKMLELYQKTDLKKKYYKTTLLNSLSCAEDPDIIINYLNILVFNTSLFHEEKHSFIFMSILKKHSRNDLILDYILNNLEIIKPKSLTTTAIMKLILQQMFSSTQIDKIKKFSDVNFEHDPKTRIAIEKLTEKRRNELKESVDSFKKWYD